MLSYSQANWARKTYPIIMIMFRRIIAFKLVKEVLNQFSLSVNMIRFIFIGNIFRAIIYLKCSF